ncbi:MAG: hypothetical protein AVDCRST_MAG52-198, partial [uncultured Blastococcus sp.]
DVRTERSLRRPGAARPAPGAGWAAAGLERTPAGLERTPTAAALRAAVPRVRPGALRADRLRGPSADGAAADGADRHRRSRGQPGHRAHRGGRHVLRRGRAHRPDAADRHRPRPHRGGHPVQPDHRRRHRPDHHRAPGPLPLVRLEGPQLGADRHLRAGRHQPGVRPHRRRDGPEHRLPHLAGLVPAAPHGRRDRRAGAEALQRVVPLPRLAAGQRAGL